MDEVLTAWGKSSADSATGTTLFLSLRDHSMDVAEVFRALAALPLFKRKLDSAARLTLTQAQLDRLAVFALLHDLGKANWGFQNKLHGVTPAVGHIVPLQALIAEEDLEQRLATLIADLCDWFELGETAVEFLVAVWSHHGSPVRLDPAIRTGNHRRWWLVNGHRDPFASIAELMATARTAFPAAFSYRVPPLPTAPALQHRCAGLVMLADWLGSHPMFFPLDRQAGFDGAAAARRALAAVGLDSSAAQGNLARRPQPFITRFGLPPRPLQAVMDNLEPANPAQRLLIAEAETGSGKTEAALAHFFRLFAAGEVQALYFALPTRVAARELYRRVRYYLRRAFPDPRPRPQAVLAVPGYARVGGVPLERLLPPDEVRLHDEPAQRLAERIWAAEHPKRFLAATVAVGTIDQALLSAVQTRHVHLRSVCLDRSLLVVDEVHASDPYMRYLLRGLLSHHIGLGGQALLLSATLGAIARAEWVAAGAGTPVTLPNLADALTTPYPALTGLDACTQAVAGTNGPPKIIRFELLPVLDQPATLLPDLTIALAAGARVLVVMNTVGRAVALQKQMEAALPPAALFQCAGVVCPHHGRFAPADRERMDKAVSTRFGKGSPPGPLALVGTQTLEQSLDIDADLLITDLCPADVLLQRVGRLHRHSRPRPPGYGQPRCLVLVPAAEDLEALLDNQGEPIGAAKAAGLGSVYPDLRCLELTRRLLQQTPVLEIPGDNRRLVEGATHPDCLEALASPRWQRHGQSIAGQKIAEELAGWAAAAQFNLPFTETGFQDVADQPQARTRLGLDSRRLQLKHPLIGPFGSPIDELICPGYWLTTASPNEAPIVLSSSSDGLILRVGDQTLRYSRFGLEKHDESFD